jgi:serine phosphatase RsbU (regulator of sigma subunit)
MSDGFPELQNENNEMIGYSETRRIFEEVAERTPEEIVNHFKVKGQEWNKGRENEDDITFVVIKVK